MWRSNFTRDGWFCAKEGVLGKDAHVVVHSKHEHLGLSQKWIESSVTIPRCTVCEGVHKKDRIIRYLSLGLSLPLAGAVEIWIDAGWTFWVVLFVGGPLMARLVSKLAFPVFGGDRKPLRQVAKHPQVVQMKADGWSVGRPASTDAIDTVVRTIQFLSGNEDVR